MKIKKCLSLVLSAALVMTGVLPSAVAGAQAGIVSETADTRQENGKSQGSMIYMQATELSQDVFGELPDHDELFAAYVDGLFLGDHSASLYADFGKEKLDGINLKAYEVLKGRIGQIASGEAADSIITLNLADLGITKQVWTAEELGVPQISVNEDGNVSQEVMDALMPKLQPDLREVLSYLLADCPWELYWYDKTAGVRSEAGIRYAVAQEVNPEDNTSYYVLHVSEFEMKYSFAVAGEYRESENTLYKTDVRLAQSAKDAAGKASAIVAANAGLNDYEKLEAYKDSICGLVSYNHGAVENNSAYGNPWQLIWVFDENPDTGVVCEGYAKAFQYLCDMSVFRSGDVKCYTVNGTMGGGTGFGGHMWNIVTMEDNNNYIVDVTNCDEGSVGSPDKLFLAGARGSATGGYAVIVLTGAPNAEGYTVTYAYDSEMPGMYGDILNISDTGYEPQEDDGDHGLYGKFGDTIDWSVDLDGKLHLVGTGDMPNVDSADQIPWNAHKDKITEILFTGSITSIGKSAFSGCTGLNRVDLPESITLIGDNAFDGCSGIQELTIPASVVEIGRDAFLGCSSLKQVKFLGACPQGMENGGWTGPFKILYPIANKQSWQDFFKTETLGDGITGEEYCSVHAIETVVAKPATCTEDGIKAHFVCRGCNTYYLDVFGTEEITEEETVETALGHTFVWIVEIQPTALTEGKRYEECTVCRSRGREEALPPLGGHVHTYGDDYESDPSCHWQVCTECQAESEKVPHSFGAWSVKTEGSCFVQQTESRSCLQCRYEDIRVTGLCHNLTEIKEIEATCQRAGQKRHWECSGCGGLFLDSEGRVAASLQDLEIPMAAHNTNKINANDPTCTKPGNIEYYTCTACGGIYRDIQGNESISIEDTIITARHNYGEWITVEEPGCTRNGLREGTCSACQDVRTEEIEALGHTMRKTEAVSATCTQTGNIEYYTCIRCDKVYCDKEGAVEILAEDTVVAVIGHTYSEWVIVKEPDTEEAGLRQRECGVCGFEEAEEIPALGHNWEEGYTIDIEPSCATEGRRSIHCKDCGKVKDIEAIPAYGHRFGEWIIVTPQACTQTGIRRRTCSVCDYEETGNMAALGHNWEDAYTIDHLPTCTTEGLQSVQCAVCGETRAEPIPAAGHNMVKTKKQEATCTSDGNIEYYTCSICSRLYLDANGEQEVSEAEVKGSIKAKHQYETVIVPATTAQNGAAYNRCVSCGIIADTRVICCPKTVTLSAVSYIYNGKPQKPAVIVYDSKGNVIPQSSYTVAYSNHKNVGKASAQITFIGEYRGTVTRTFTIKPKGTSVSKLKAASKGFTVSWKKNKKQTSGYQIQFAAKKNFKGAKIRTYEGVTKATVLKLKADKKYYVRIRTYKAVDGVRIYSNWSKAKQVTAKK